MLNKVVEMWSKVDERFQNILGRSKAQMEKVHMGTQKSKGEEAFGTGDLNLAKPGQCLD